MQCINFKSRLDREREMIRRKIRSSTLYRKPSFSKSAFNIYNANGEVTKVSCITKNLKINEFKDEPIRKVKSPLLVNDEQEDECTNEEKSILCIGSKYLDLTSNLMAPPLIKSVSTSTINLNSHDLSIEKPPQQEADFEKAISQSHLSPSSPSIMINGNHLSSSKKSSLNETSMQENLKKSKTANTSDSNSKSNINSSSIINNNKKILLLSLHSDYDKTSENEEDESTENKRNNHNNNIHKTIPTNNNNNNNNNHTSKIFKKSAQTIYCGAVGHNVGKYSDAQRTEIVLDDLSNSIVEQSNKYDIINNNTNILNNNLINSKISPNSTNTVSSNSSNTSKTVKKSAATTTRKKSKRSDTMKCDSVKPSATRKSESSQMT